MARGVETSGAAENGTLRSARDASRAEPFFRGGRDDARRHFRSCITARGDRRGVAKTEGVSIGQTVADRILALRSNDGSNAAPPPFVFGTVPGDYQSTPPNFPPQPQFTHWSGVTLFALQSADQFRPGPPPALTSHAYSAALNEVMSLGIASSTSATPDRALTGQFWNGAIQNYWNEIAQTASVAHGLSTAQNARLFALLNFSLADSVIAFYDAKYTYGFGRPVTAIRAADTDGNAHTAANPTWLPEVTKTTPVSSLSGRTRGHQCRRGIRFDHLLRPGSVRLQRHVGGPSRGGALVHEILYRRTGGDVEPHLRRGTFPVRPHHGWPARSSRRQGG